MPVACHGHVRVYPRRPASYARVDACPWAGRMCWVLGADETTPRPNGNLTQAASEAARRGASSAPQPLAIFPAPRPLWPSWPQRSLLPTSASSSSFLIRATHTPRVRLPSYTSPSSPREALRASPARPPAPRTAGSGRKGKCLPLPACLPGLKQRSDGVQGGGRLRLPLQGRSHRRLRRRQIQPALQVHAQRVQPRVQVHHRGRVCHQEHQGRRQGRQGPDLGHRRPGEVLNPILFPTLLLFLSLGLFFTFILCWIYIHLECS